MDGVVCGGNTKEARQGAWDGDDAEERFGISSALAAQKERDGEGFVQDVRKGMRGVDGDRRKHRVNATFVKCFCRERGFGVKLGNGEDADGLFRESGKNLVVPAFVLVANKNVHALGDFGKFQFGGQTVRADALRALFDLLEKAGDANFDEFIEIVRCDGEEFDALKKRVARVARFLQHATIELQPLNVAIEVVTRILE